MMGSRFLSQFKLLCWKQFVLLRSDWMSTLSVVLLPSILMYLSATNSGGASVSNSVDARPCKVDSVLYCNYPMRVSTDLFYSINATNETDKNTTKAQLLEAVFLAGEKMATYLDVDTEKVDYLALDVDKFPYKSGGTLEILNDTYITVEWIGKNNEFPNLFVDKFSEYLRQETYMIGYEKSVQVESVSNRYEWEGGPNVFDLRLASFLLLLQGMTQCIVGDKFDKMYFYLTRSGLLVSVYWIFHFLYYSVVGLVSTALLAGVAEAANKEVDVGAYCIAVWFHVALGLVLGAALPNKKWVNLSTSFILVLVFAMPIAFTFSANDNAQKVYRYIRMIPFYFTNESDLSVTETRVGCAISAGTMALAAYLVPLVAVSEGMFVGCSRNYLYFLTKRFWKEGIVCLPPYKNDSEQISSIEGGTKDDVLVFQNVMKVFHYHKPIKERIRNIIMFRKAENKVTTKTIGPMNVSLSVGKITTLLGKNGVGKSTLMRVAAGYFIPSGGEMKLSKTNIFRESPTTSLQSISFCPQDNYLFDYLTVDEHLDFMVNLRSDSLNITTSVENHKTWILTTLNIVHKRDTLAMHLSGGMKRRLCLAMATIGFPKVMIVDEASSGVDTVNQRGVWKLLETCKYHSAILMTSHSPLEAVVLSDSVITMSSSTEITQSGRGTNGIGLTVKNPVDKSVDEYTVTSDTVENIPDVLARLPNDGSEWKIASRRLNSDVSVLPLREARTKYGSLRDSIISEREIATAAVADTAASTDDGIPETKECATPGIFGQIVLLLQVTMLHPDRMFMLIVFIAPLNGLLIWFAYALPGWGSMGKTIAIPMIPLLIFVPGSVIMSNAATVLAQEKELGISKLLFSQGISRVAYLASYVLYYGIASFPTFLGALLAIGHTTGASAASSFALFILFTSFWTLHMGLSLLMGLVLSARTSFVATCVLPSAMAIFAQGPVTEAFANKYPGSNGQVLSGLLINDLSNSEWGLYAMTVVVNTFLGLIGFGFFLSRFENHNQINGSAENLLCWKKTTVDPDQTQQEEGEVTDIENNEEILLEGKHLVKTYGKGVKNSDMFLALDDVSFAVPPGSLLGLVGESGAGKSTLMDILSGQIAATEGRLYIEGKKVNPTQVSTVVSLCGQVDTIWPEMPVVNAIKIFMRCRGYGSSSFSIKGISDPYVNYIIEQLGMKEMLKKPVKKLSGGQKRRLAFLVSLVGSTRVVLNDESMTGVDVETRQIMWKILQDEVNLRNRSVVVTTHDISEVEQYCNTVGILHSGKLLEMGELVEIKKKFGDSIKVIFLLSSSPVETTADLTSSIEEKITEKHADILTIDSVEVDVLEESRENQGGITLATYSINLISINNVPDLVFTLDGMDNDLVQYWSIQPVSLDDFVRAAGQTS